MAIQMFPCTAPRARRLHHELADSHSYCPLTPESPLDGTARATFTGSHPQAGATSLKHHTVAGIDEISLQAIMPESQSHLLTPTSEPVSIATTTPQRSPSRRTAADTDIPHVVVVSPTPNLTPHPTCPQTPVLPPAPAAPLPKNSTVSHLPTPRSLQEKEKQTQHLTRTGQPFEIFHSRGEDDGDDDDDWTSADEADEVEDVVMLQALTRPKARSHSPPPPPPPSPIMHRTTRSCRQMPTDMQKHLRMDELHRAFEEAERQKETFSFHKLPKRSYSKWSRTNTGLLSQLMHPDPQALPNIYDRGYSSGDLTEKPRLRAPQLHPSQSAVALPVATQVHVGSVRNGGMIKMGDYRPKARPNEEDMEDETDGEDNSLNVSSSVAQEKLKAIFGNMCGGGANANANKVAPIRPPHVECREKKAAPRTQTTMPAEHPVAPVAAALERMMTEPVAVPTYPYNLRVSAIPVSPRTTRQWMLRTEMSESVRTNLLWQRKQPPRRNKSSTAISTIRSVVKLTAKKVPSVDGGIMAEQEREEARNEIRRVNLMRNKSWVADYHPQ